MADAASKAITPNKSLTPKEKEVTTLIDSRQSKEIFIALCGPIGCGLPDVLTTLTAELKSLRYEIEYIHLSDLMQEAIGQYSNLTSLNVHLLNNQDSKFDRITKLQSLGNALRQATNHAAVAQLAIKYIATLRERKKDSDAPLIPNERKTAFIIDQLKHPAEVQLFRNVYDSVFYQIGVLAHDEAKIQRLKNDDITTDQAATLIERDKRDCKGAVPRSA